jgi:hypothetical protein
MLVVLRCSTGGPGTKIVDYTPSTVDGKTTE